MNLQAEAPFRVGEGVADSCFSICHPVWPIHWLKPKVSKVQVDELGRIDALLRKNKFQFVTAALAELGAGRAGNRLWRCRSTANGGNAVRRRIPIGYKKLRICPAEACRKNERPQLAAGRHRCAPRSRRQQRYSLGCSHAVSSGWSSSSSRRGSPILPTSKQGAGYANTRALRQGDDEEAITCQAGGISRRRQKYAWTVPRAILPRRFPRHKISRWAHDGS